MKRNKVFVCWDFGDIAGSELRLGFVNCSLNYFPVLLVDITKHSMEELTAPKNIQAIPVGSTGVMIEEPLCVSTNDVFWIAGGSPQQLYAMCVELSAGGQIGHIAHVNRENKFVFLERESKPIKHSLYVVGRRGCPNGCMSNRVTVNKADYPVVVDTNIKADPSVIQQNLLLPMSVCNACGSRQTLEELLPESAKNIEG